MLRSFITAGRRAFAAAHASPISTHSPLLSAPRNSVVAVLLSAPRRGLFVRSALPTARLASCSALIGRPSHVAPHTAISGVIGRKESDERGFTRASILLVRARSARTQPLPEHTPASSSAADSQTAPPAAETEPRFFLSPVGPATPLSWRDRFRFLFLESCTLVASLGVGSIVSQAAASAAPVLAPNMDALVLFFSANGLTMPAATLAYLSLLYARSQRGGSFTLPPPPRPVGGMTWRGWLFLAAVVLGFWVRHSKLALVAPPVNERDIILEASLDDQWSPAAQVGFIVPVLEETLYRGLLFARCARFIGVGSAVMFSSLAFALGHGSVAPGAMLMGMVFAGLYSTTGSLLAPIALHSALNSSLLWDGRRFSPMTPLDTLAESFESKFALLKQRGFFSCVSRAELAAMLAAVKSQSQPQVRQQCAANARSIFAALDRGDKGQLDASEIAWLMTLRPDEPRLLNAVLGVIERRVGGDEDDLLAVQRNMDRMPANTPLLELPHARFIPDANRLVLIDQTAATAGPRPEQPRRPFHPFVQRINAAPLIPIEPRVQAMQSELLHRYYSIQWNALYRAHFPSGCDSAAFEAFFCRAFPSADEQKSLLWSLRADDEGAHPVAQLVQEHRSGRQSFGGVTRRLGTDVAPSVAPINPAA